MHPFRAAVEARDHDAMVACLTDDVLLYSPVAFKPFSGKESVRGLFDALFQVFEDFRYVDELEGDEQPRADLPRDAWAGRTSRASTTWSSTTTAWSPSSRS